MMSKSTGHIAFAQIDGKPYELFLHTQGYCLVPEYMAIGLDTGHRYATWSHVIGATLDEAFGRMAELGCEMG
jgi:hypothetical protein